MSRLPVVGFYGAFYDSDAVYLALQYCNAGSLQSLCESNGTSEMGVRIYNYIMLRQFAIIL